MANVRKQDEELQANSLTLHLMYTFLFSSFDLEESFKNNVKEDQLKKSLCSMLKLKEGEISIYTEEGKCNGKQKLFDHYLDPFLHLKMSYIEIISKVDVSNQNQAIRLFEYNNNGDYIPSRIKLTSLERKIILLESGQGVEDFVLRFSPINQKYIGKLDIVYLSNIGMRRKQLEEQDDRNRNFSQFMLNQHNKEIFLFEIFFKDITNLKKALEENVNPQKKYILQKSYIQRKENERLFKWVDTDEELKLVGDVQKYGSELHFQDPFPVICLSIPDKVYAYNFLDPEQRKVFLKGQNIKYIRESKANPRLFKELLMLLFRSKLTQFQDMTFAKGFNLLDEGRVPNMCSNSSVFLYLYSRSAVTVSTKNSLLKKHADYIVPAFIETIHYLRMRWHTYVIASQWQDRIIESLSRNSTDFRDVLKKIIASRRDISRALSDPLTYRLGSGSMDKIYEIGLNIFRIDELRKIIVDKFSMIDALYSNLFEYEKVQELDMIEEEIRKSKEGKAI
jgi:hypothetical protein